MSLLDTYSTSCLCLFLFPYAGGSLGPFIALSIHMSARLVCPISQEWKEGISSNLSHTQNTFLAITQQFKWFWQDVIQMFNRIEWCEVVTFLYPKSRRSNSLWHHDILQKKKSSGFYCNRTAQEQQLGLLYNTIKATLCTNYHKDKSKNKVMCWKRVRWSKH